MDDLSSTPISRRSIYVILILVSLATSGAQLARVRSQLGSTPLLSANDRSRWCTVRALVDHGTYAIDDVVMPGGKRDREWYTIDMVKHIGPDGREHFYSSKPALFPTLLAGLYWAVKAVAGVNLASDSFYVIRGMLVLVNLVPLALYFWLATRLVERWGTTDWGRCFTVAVAALGTLLTTFSVTLNNHIPAAVGAAVTGYVLLRIAADGRREPRYFVVAGFAAAWTVANELPALLLLVGAALVTFRCAPRRAAWAFLIPALIVGVAFQVTNHWAHRSWRPAYGHRSDGPLLGTVQAAEPATNRKHTASAELLNAVRTVTDGGLTSQATLRPRDTAHQWELSDLERGIRYALEWRGDQVDVRRWDNWYDYEGTYWQDSKKKGVDRGEADAGVYAFHVLIGHHGIFSLTPVWLLAVWGAFLWCTRFRPALRWAALSAAAMTVICLAFYLTRPLIDRNYGGVSCGMRWTLWLIPFWLFCLLPAADVLSKSRWGRGLALAAFAVGVFSAVYNATNPWSHPWIFEYWTSLGWIKYS